MKTEVDSAIQGKQWLLSCFGPFKESTVLPNFIQDRSFEEVRLDFLEASKTGIQQQHVEELVGQYNDALIKLNLLKSLTPDTIQLLATIYNESTLPDHKKSSQTPATNVFASSNAAQQSAQSQQNPFQMGNIFGGSKQQQQTPAMNTGSIFGSSTTTSNPFQQSQQTSIFGGGMKEQPQPIASNFSFALNHPTQQQSTFGFNQSTQQSQMPSLSIFGAGQTNTFGSMIGAPAQQQPSQQTFGSSIFGQSKLSGPTMGLYNQTAQQPTGTFGTALPLQQVATALGQAQSASAQSTLFQQLNGHVFNQFQAQTAAQPQNAVNPFTQTVPSQNVYAMQTQQEQQQAPPAPAGSIFHIHHSNPQQVVGENPFQTQAPQIDESVYSRPEDLTPEEIRAFQAGTFTLGQIPLKPPPKQLCL